VTSSCVVENEEAGGIVEAAETANIDDKTETAHDVTYLIMSFAISCWRCPQMMSRGIPRYSVTLYYRWAFLDTAHP